MNKQTIYIIIGVIVAALAVWLLVGQRGGDDQVSDTTEQASQLDESENTPSTINEQGESAMTTNESECTRTFTNADLESTVVSPEDAFVTLDVKDFGKIKIQVNKADAPNTSENFLKLAKAGFYNCLTFHRVAQGFVIQGGDPEGTGAGGPGYTIPAEIGLLHEKGSVAMARTGDAVNPERNSSGSQFYIALNKLDMLDGQYTVFAQVVEGLDVVEQIGAVKIDSPLGDGAPQEPVIITEATVSAE